MWKRVFTPQYLLRKPFLYRACYSTKPPSELYKDYVSQNKLRFDERQIAILKHLDNLHQQLKHYTPPEPKPKSTVSSWFSTSTTSNEDDTIPENTPKSIYMYGGVGCGKTMLMDMFYESVETPKKQRIHFNSFMLKFHQRIHQLRSKKPGKDYVPDVIEEIMEKSWLLCFDEFQVTDIADAMILKRIFEGLFKRGAVMVATSNRPPDDLYYNGINRASFLPFIDFLKNTCIIHDMDSEHDYRLTGLKAKDVYMDSVSEEVDKRIEELFNKLTYPEKAGPTSLKVMGRLLHIPEAARRVAKFHFDDLCKQELGAVDFNAIATHFHTVIVTNIPTLNVYRQRDIVRRFILLIDELYQHRVKLICSAVAQPDELFVDEQGKPMEKPRDDTAIDEAFAFSRTVSRLHEMQTENYLESAHMV